MICKASLEALQQGTRERRLQESLLDPSASPSANSSNKKKREYPAAGDSTAQGVIVGSPAGGTEWVEVKSGYSPDSNSDGREKQSASSSAAQHGLVGAANTAGGTDKCCILHMDSLGMHGTMSIGNWLKR
jgi:hypothetical protein